MTASGTAATPAPEHRPLSALEEKALEQVFTSHQPSAQQTVLYGRINTATQEFARTILECCPKGTDRTAALRLVTQARMTANSAIALEGVNAPW